MAVFKCKMCGGTIEFSEGASVGICDSCGTKQTLPRLDDDRRANMYDRANHFRRNNEFDKATGIYEQILNEDGEDAEAYWSLVLCRYGIEYVKDPSTHKRVPTVNRAQYTGIFDDDNYKSAIRYADPEQKAVYEAEANAINKIQKGILAISQKEEPFDVFICYKETDENGRRTQDSVLANDLYHQLTQEGFKVFFSRITLEDKLGTAYEPYIFAALNSSKVMVVIGTRPEYFNAVWVKNEWSRYLALVKQSGGKKLLIPAYRDMDPYDLPEEFSHLQAQDMGKLGFMQDLIRGIGKVISADGDKAENKETFSESDSRIAPLLKRTFMFLEDGEWDEADKYAEKVLDMDPECAEAYLAKMMAELKVRKREALADLRREFSKNSYCSKIFRFGNERLKAEIRGYLKEFDLRKKYAEKLEMLEDVKHLSRAKRYEEAITQLEKISDLAEAQELILACRKKIEEEKIRKREEEEKRAREEEKRAREEEIRRKRNRKLAKIVCIIAAAAIAVLAAAAIAIKDFIIPEIKYRSTYNSAIKMLEEGDYANSLIAFKSIYGYKDSKKYVNNFIVEAEKEEFGTDSKATVERKFDENGRVIHCEWMYFLDDGEFLNGDTEAYEYDENGNCVKIRHEDIGMDPGYSIDEFVYSDDGKLISRKISGEDEAGEYYENVYRYFHDDRGNIVKIFTTREASREYEYDEMDNIVNEKVDGTTGYVYKYDKAGNCIYKREYGMTYNYEYDDKGNRIKEVKEGNGSSRTTYKYDKYGNCVESHHDSDSGNYVTKTTYTGIHVRYDENLSKKKALKEVLGWDIY